jgi:hypothetical protein
MIVGALAALFFMTTFVLDRAMSLGGSLALTLVGLLLYLWAQRSS